MTLDRDRTRRRSHGDGSVFYDKARDRWVGQLRISTPDGRRRTRKVTATTEREAARLLRELQHQQRTGHDITAGSMIVTELIDKWLRDVAPLKQNPKTVEINRTMIRTRITPTLGSMRVTAVTPDHIEQAIAGWVDDGLARSTVMKLRGILIGAFRVAEQRRVVTWNPARLANLPPKSATPEPRERQVITEQQTRELLAASRDSRLWLWLWLGFSTGARPAELSGLHWEQIDLDAGVLHIDRSLHYYPAGPVIGPPKTRRAVRTIELPAELVTALHDHRRAQAIERDAHGGWPAEWAGLVFPTANGRPIGERDLRRDIIALGRRIGIENLTPYCLRTTVTSILSESDAVPPEQLADLLGHVDTTMVMRHYRKRITRSVNVAAGLGSRIAAGSQP